MKEQGRVEVSGSHVVSQIIEGEAIIINLDSGKYYSLQNTGAEIWAGVQEGIATKEIVNRLLLKYASDDETIRLSVMALLGQLEAEALIASHGAVGDDGLSAEAPDGDRLDGIPFVPPVLQIYTDMQELLLLDPIHEVNASDWPEPPTANTASDE